METSLLALGFLLSAPVEAGATPLVWIHDEASGTSIARAATINRFVELAELLLQLQPLL